MSPHFTVLGYLVISFIDGRSREELLRFGLTLPCQCGETLCLTAATNGPTVQPHR
jgi:hypothetical protein